MKRKSINPQAEARKLLADCGIKKAPVKLEKVARHLDVQIVEKSMSDEDCGFVYIDGNRAVIGINSIHPDNRRRFTLAHEIGHLVMHKEYLWGDIHLDKKFSQKLLRDGRSSTGEDFKEVQANRFAAELLMPTELLKKDLKSKVIDIEGNEWDALVSELANKYEVSPQAMSIRLGRLLAEDVGF